MSRELITKLCEQIGAYGLQCSQTNELAPTTEFSDTIKQVEAALAAIDAQREEARNAGLEEVAKEADHWHQIGGIDPKHVCGQYIAAAIRGHKSPAPTPAPEQQKLRDQYESESAMAEDLAAIAAAPSQPSSMTEREAPTEAWLFEWEDTHGKRAIVSRFRDEPAFLGAYEGVTVTSLVRRASIASSTEDKDAERLDFLEGEEFVSLHRYDAVYGADGMPLEKVRTFFQLETMKGPLAEGSTARAAIDAAIDRMRSEGGKADV
jgi:hypothetical protein